MNTLPTRRGPVIGEGVRSDRYTHSSGSVFFDGGELGSTGARCYNEATEWFRKNQP